MCFRWTNHAEGPILHCASQVVLMFNFAFGKELKSLRLGSASEVYDALAQHVERAVRDDLPSVLQLAHRGIKPRGVAAVCRVNGSKAELECFGLTTDVNELDSAINRGVKRGTESFDFVTSGPKATIVAFVGRDHLALGVQVLKPREASETGIRFAWRDVPRFGMELQLAGAMGVLAAECCSKAGGGVIVDPTCGCGTTLLAAARCWRGEYPRVIGCDTDPQKVEWCSNNFTALGLEGGACYRMRLRKALGASLSHGRLAAARVTCGRAS